MATKSRSARKREERRDESTKDAAMDMTPMIDVVFLLIIFFLCIDFRVLEAKLPAHLPKDRGSIAKQEDPKDQLRLRIVCDAVGDKELRPSGRSHRLTGHRVHYELGSRDDLRTLEELRRELQIVYEDPGRRVVDQAAPAGSRPIPVVVEPGPGTVYGDVTPCVDAVAATGFTEITFGGGLGRR